MMNGWVVRWVQIHTKVIDRLNRLDINMQGLKVTHSFNMGRTKLCKQLP